MTTTAAVVTGASSGIGAAIADTLRSRGVSVYDLSRRTTNVDVTDQDAVVRAYDWFTSTPPLLVVCAGIISPVHFDHTTVAEWRRVLDVNLTGAFIVAREHAKRLIREGRSGRLMFIGSPSGRRPSLENLAYGVSKAGVLALGLGLARGLEPHGIKVYILCPSHIDTPMLHARGFDDLDEKRLLAPDEFAKTAVGLLLDDEYLDGQPIYVSSMVTAKQR